MTKKSNARLTQAMYEKALVKFWNPYDEGSTHGYVLDIGPRFFLLGLVDDRIRFNGFQCMHMADVRRLRVAGPQAEFIVAALLKRGESIRSKPRVNLTNVSELLKSANRLFPLVAIHQERINPDSCKIGRVIGISKSHLSLLEIGTDAHWDEEPTEIPLRQVTRVDFGGGYEDALHMVGGSPDLSKWKSAKRRSARTRIASVSTSTETPLRS